MIWKAAAPKRSELEESREYREYEERAVSQLTASTGTV